MGTTASLSDQHCPELREGQVAVEHPRVPSRTRAAYIENFGSADERLYPLPDRVDPVQAVAVFHPAGAAFLGLVRDVGGVHPGHLVLGTVVSVVSPRPTQPSPRAGVRFAWFTVEPGGGQLRQIGALLDVGQIRPVIDRVFPLVEAREAYKAARDGHPHSKIVHTFD